MWENNVIIPSYKKGGKYYCKNNRAICLASMVFKMYTKIVDIKLRKELQYKLEIEQKQTQAHKNVVRKTIERANEQGKVLYLVFVDL